LIQFSSVSVVKKPIKPKSKTSFYCSETCSSLHDYLKYKQNQSYKLQHNIKGRNLKNTSQSIKKNRSWRSIRTGRKTDLHGWCTGQSRTPWRGTRATKKHASKPICHYMGVFTLLLQRVREHWDGKMSSETREWVGSKWEPKLCTFVKRLCCPQSFWRRIEQRLSLKQKPVDKEFGCNLIEVDVEVHEFVVGGEKRVWLRR